MTTPPLADVRIRSNEELTAHWTALLDPPTFGARSLWLTWLDDQGLMLPLVIPIDDVPLIPDDYVLRGVLQMHDTVIAQRGVAHLALALCRPGDPVLTEDDDEWVEALRADLDDGIDETWSLHLAAGGAVVSVVDYPA